MNAAVITHENNLACALVFHKTNGEPFTVTYTIDAVQNQIVNYSGMDLLATSVEISVTYQNNRKVVESLLVDSAKSTEGIISENPAPYVLIRRFDNYAAVYELRAYTNRANEFLRIQSEIRKNIYDSFQKYGIDLTVPQAQMNFDTDNEGLDEKYDKERLR